MPTGIVLTLITIGGLYFLGKEHPTATFIGFVAGFFGPAWLLNAFSPGISIPVVWYFGWSWIGVVVAWQIEKWLKRTGAFTPQSPTVPPVDEFKNVIKKIDLHKKFLNGEEGGKKANLKGAYMKGINLAGVDLTGADLRGANLTKANLQGANLTGANLANLWGTNTSIENANLRDAILVNADMSYAILHNADLSGANLKGADLTYAHFHDVIWTGAQLEGTRMPDGLIYNSSKHTYVNPKE
ncbi:MAG TPA: pentapeptide repeat-containing protein [Longilinea sp.]|nr:pentapeptide repeat-containing protein [Longilinea sp.]